MRSLLDRGIDLRALRLDTAIAAYLLDPAENRYALAELLERYTPHSMATDDAAAGQLDLGGSAVDDAQRAARAALAVNRLAPAVEAALEAQGMRRLYDEIENPLVRVLARMEHAGVGRRRRRAAPAPPAPHRGLQAPAGGGAPGRGPVVQPQLHAAAAPDPVRRAGPHAPEAHQDRLLHRRRVAGAPARPVARAHRPAPRVPGGREAAVDLRRGAPERGRTRRSHPRHVQPDRGPHRPAVVRPAQPAQHPGALRRGPAVPAGLRPAAGVGAPGRRLQPDRAALHRPPGRRPRADRRVRGPPGHPQRHRVADLRRRPRGGHPSSSGRRRRWCPTAWPTAWRPSGSASA